VHNHVAVIEQEPAFPGLSLQAAFFLVIFLRRFQHGFGERGQHAVAGAVAYNEIISKRCDIFDVEKQDVFTLFVLQGIDDFMREFECVQVSPLYVLPQRPHTCPGGRCQGSSLSFFSDSLCALWLILQWRGKQPRINRACWFQVAFVQMHRVYPCCAR